MQRYITNPQVIHETIEGETIIIDLATGTYYSLQGAAPVIWGALAAGETSPEIVQRLRDAYEGLAPDVESVVGAFLRELEAEQLVALAPNGNEPSPSPTAKNGSAANAEGAPFVPPKLEKYTDMQDIILLDPVHKVDERGWPHAAPVDQV